MITACSVHPYQERPVHFGALDLSKTDFSLAYVGLAIARNYTMSASCPELPLRPTPLVWMSGVPHNAAVTAGFSDCKFGGSCLWIPWSEFP